MTTPENEEAAVSEARSGSRRFWRFFAFLLSPRFWLTMLGLGSMVSSFVFYVNGAMSFAAAAFLFVAGLVLVLICAKEFLRIFVMDFLFS